MARRSDNNPIVIVKGGKKRRSPDNNPVPVVSDRTSPNTGSPNTGSPNTGGPNTGGPNTGGPNTGRGSYKGATGAEARALRREDEAKEKAGNRFLEQAKNLELQARTLEIALRKSFARARKQNLRDVDQALRFTLEKLESDARLRAEEFLDQARNTEMATSTQLEEGVSNLIRERQESLAQVLAQGAGGTDAARAMLQAARNWSDNAKEGARAYFDSMSSINQNITDLNADVSTTLSNTWIQSQAERDRIWQEYYDSRGEAFTQLGNIRGQQLDYYAQAAEMDVSPKKGLKKKAKESQEWAMLGMRRSAGKSYAQEKPPNRLRDFKAADRLEPKYQGSKLNAAPEIVQLDEAEGAGLRRWAA